MQKHIQDTNSKELQALADSFGNILDKSNGDPASAAVSIVSFMQILIEIDRGIEDDEDSKKQQSKV